MVLIYDKAPRNRWKTGVVTETFTGSDGFIRGCKVRTLTKTGRVTHLNRPVNKLYSLEISCAIERDTNSDRTVNSNCSDGKILNEDTAVAENAISERRSRVRRVAAETGILKRMLSKQS